MLMHRESGTAASEDAMKLALEPRRAPSGILAFWAGRYKFYFWAEGESPLAVPRRRHNHSAPCKKGTNTHHRSKAKHMQQPSDLTLREKKSLRKQVNNLIRLNA